MRLLAEGCAEDLEAFWPSNFGPKMKLTRQNAASVAGSLRKTISRPCFFEVLYNNLGGQGPNASDPPVPWL